MELANTLLQTLLEVAMPIVITAAVTWLISKWVDIFKKLNKKNPDVAAFLMEICHTAVRAAEQIFGGEKGKEKKAYAMKIVKAYLKQLGINLNLETIDAAIEAAVLEMNWEMMWKLDEPESTDEPEPTEVVEKGGGE